MKKTFLVLAMLFASFSSNLAFAGSQSYTSPWRKAYYEGEEGIDQMHVNISSYCDVLRIMGNYYPSYYSNDPGATYFDLGAYQNGTLIYTYYNNSFASFGYEISDYSYWSTIDVYMNISSGVGAVTVEWY